MGDCVVSLGTIRSQVKGGGQSLLLVPVVGVRPDFLDVEFDAAA